MTFSNFLRPRHPLSLSLICGIAHAQAPQPPEIAAKSFLLLDLTTAQTLAASATPTPRPTRPR